MAKSNPPRAALSANRMANCDLSSGRRTCRPAPETAGRWFWHPTGKRVASETRVMLRLNPQNKKKGPAEPKDLRAS